MKQGFAKKEIFSVRELKEKGVTAQDIISVGFSGIEIMKEFPDYEIACRKTLQGHSNWVRCVVQLSDGSICSGSGDNSLKIWNVSNGECLKTLQGHSGNVICVVQLSDGSICSGSNDNSLKIWN
jgi:WD40 repeat protein